MQSLVIHGRDGHPVHVHAWPVGAPRAVVQIAHGMGEHGARYAGFARALNAAGFAAYASDHRGHGRTAPGGTHGDLGPDGWNRVVEDALELNRALRRRHPHRPVVLFGHSMGAMLAQQYLVRYSGSVDAAVISGSPGFAHPVAALLPMLFASIEAWRLGAGAHSPLLQGLLFGKSNDPFAGPDATGFEWLSRDPAQVRAYVDDPDCGFVLAASSLRDLFRGAREAARPGNVACIRRDLPVYVFSGTDDPVHAEWSNIDRMLAAWRAVGMDVESRAWPGGRHEMLNETNREAVYADVIGWIERRVPGLD